MKAITSHRLRNGFLLSLVILIGTILIVFLDNFIKVFRDQIFAYIFFIALSISIISIIYTHIIELLKSESKFKEERVNTLKNRIDFYNKEISEIEKEIEKIK